MKPVLWAFQREGMNTFIKSFSDSWGLPDLHCSKLFWAAWTKCQAIISLASPWFQLQPVELRSREWEWGLETYKRFLNPWVLDTMAGTPEPSSEDQWESPALSCPLISRTASSACAQSCFSVSKFKWGHLSAMFKPRTDVFKWAYWRSLRLSHTI